MGEGRDAWWVRREKLVGESRAIGPGGKAGVAGPLPQEREAK